MITGRRFLLACLAWCLAAGWLLRNGLEQDLAAARAWAEARFTAAQSGEEAAAGGGESAPGEGEAPEAEEAPPPPPEPQVTFLYLDPSVGEVFSQWPLAPLDHAVLLHNLATWQPRTLALFHPLPAPQADSPALPILERGILALGLVHGCVLDAQPLVPLESLGELLPVLPVVEGGIDAIPAFSGVGDAPPEALCQGAACGFTAIDFGPGAVIMDDGAVGYPLLARWRESLVPSLALLVTLRHLRLGPEAVTVRPGEAIEIASDPPRRIPIDAAGRMRFAPEVRDLLLREPADSVLPLEIDGEVLPADVPALGREIVLVGRRLPALFDLGPAGAGAAVSPAELSAMAMVALQTGRALPFPPSPEPAAEESAPLSPDAPSLFAGALAGFPAAWAWRFGLVAFALAACLSACRARGFAPVRASWLFFAVVSLACLFVPALDIDALAGAAPPVLAAALAVGAAGLGHAQGPLSPLQPPRRRGA